MLNVNKNNIITKGFSNQVTAHLCRELCRKRGWIENQCGGCSYYAEFNADWGLCCNPKARFYLETVFEHFGCDKTVIEGWGPHSFQDEPEREYDVDSMTGLLLRCMKALETEIVRKRYRSLLLEIRHYFRSHGMAHYLESVRKGRQTGKSEDCACADKENRDQSSEEQRLTGELLRLDDERLQVIINGVLKKRKLLQPWRTL